MTLESFRFTFARMRRLLLALALTLTPTLASADTLTDLQGRGDWAGIVTLLRDSAKADELAILSDAYERLGNIVLAIDAAERCIAATTSEPLRKGLHARIVTLEARVVKVASGVRSADCRAYVDGLPAPDDAEHPLRLNPGQHKTSVRCNGKEGIVTDVVLAPGTHHLGAQEQASDKPVAPPPPAPPPKPTWPAWALMGGGGALVFASVLFAIDGGQRYSDWKNANDEIRVTPRNDARLLEITGRRAEIGRSIQLDVGLSIGLGVLGIGAVCYGWKVFPTASPSTVGLNMVGEF